MEPCDAAYKKDVLLSCYEALADQGFIKFRKENVEWPLENGFHCWVGLNTGLYAEYVEINPFSVVHSVTIERLWTSTKEGKYPGKYDRGIATYGIHLGKIAPEEKAFQFRRNVNLKVEARRLAELYVRAGLPFSKSIASYDSILPLLKNRVEMLGGNPERFASCLFLMGRAEEAQSFVKDFLSGHEEYFEGFALPFLRMIGGSAGGAVVPPSDSKGKGRAR